MMVPTSLIIRFALPLALVRASGSALSATAFDNPILPGFHPDPSCIFVPEENNTFFCASSSFNAFPGIPIHASKDLINWRLISNALNRPSQLPDLAITNGSTSGIWAPALRYRTGTFYLVTTLVHDKNPREDPKRWDNIIFQSENPWDDSSWTDAVHFEFQGYDTEPFWDDDGTAYIVGSHAYRVEPGIHINTVDLKTGKLGPEWTNLWNGTGGLAPEGPHMYRKDGYYYLMIAEGGTGLGHMETIARSKNLFGPYEPNPANPILSNTNTTEYFQTVGHADLFQDANRNWWGVALSTRSGPEYVTYPMGRETVLSNVTWETGQWPVWNQIRGKMSGWTLPPTDLGVPGEGQFVTEGDNINFEPGTKLPSHFVHWRFPKNGTYAVSPPGRPNALRITSSEYNLTGLDGNTGDPISGQSFVARRQTDTLFTYRVNIDYHDHQIDGEAGVTLFLTQNHHARFGLRAIQQYRLDPALAVWFEAISSVPVPRDRWFETIPTEWDNKTITFQIQARNTTHFTFSAGPADGSAPLRDYLVVPGDFVSWGFTGTLLGVYVTTNGNLFNRTTQAYFSNWEYKGEGQVRDSCKTC